MTLKTNGPRRAKPSQHHGSQESTTRYELLLKTSNLLCSTMDLDLVLERVSRWCVEVLEVDLALIRLVEGGYLAVKGSYFRSEKERHVVEQLLDDNPLRVGEGIAGRVVATGSPAVSDGVPVEKLTLPGFARYLSTRRWLLVPMRHQGECIGVITFITSDATRAFSPEEVDLAQGIADQAAIAIQNAQLCEAAQHELAEKTRAEGVIRRKNRELFSILRTAKMATESSQLSEAAEAICAEIVRSCSVKMAWLGLVETSGTVVVPLASSCGEAKPVDLGDVTWDEAPRGNGPVGTAIKTRRPAVCDRDDKAFLPWQARAKAHGIRSACAVPLIYEETVRGALAAYSSEPDFFNEENIETLEIFARHACLVVVNASLTREIRSVVSDLLRTMK